MTRSTSTIAAACAALLVGGLLAAQPPASAAGTDPTPGQAHSAHLQQLLRSRPVSRLIVRMRDGRATTASVRAQAARAAGAGSAAEGRRLGDGSHLVELDHPVSPDAAAAAAAAVAARPDVLWAEPDSWLYPADTPTNDPLVAQQWDLSDAATPPDWSVRAPSAWTRTTGSRSVVVAVIDTGITAHPDLAGQTVPGYDFVSLDQVDGASVPYTANDGNGRDPDPSDPGDWITAAEDAGSVDAGFFKNCGGQYADGHSDSSWHGTHVAGTVAALQNNGIGISGIAPGVLVEPVRALGKCGGSTSDIIDAIDWASGGTVAGVPTNAHPAQVINLSLGGPGTCDQATQDAISRARSRGTTVVVAAGNTHSDFATPGGSSIPASCNGVVDVVATTRAGTLASYSNYGVNSTPGSGSVTVAAPGGEQNGDAIISTSNQGTTSPASPTYATKIGTSMATPHASAVVALLQSTRAGRGFYSPDQVASLLAGLTQPASGCGPDACGLGLLDLARPMPVQVPLPVSVLQAAQADQEIDLSWQPTGDNPGDVVTYAVERNDGSGWVTVQAAGVSSATSLAVTGLTNLVSYSFRVTAVDSVGASAPVQIDDVVPTAHAIRGLSATGGVEAIAVAWTPPADMQGVTGFSVAFRPLGSTGAWSTASVPATATSTTVTTWPAPMAPGSWQVRVSADGPAYCQPVLATVTALSQTFAVSSRVVRPFVDRYQDTVAAVAASNVMASGEVRVYDARRVVVRRVALGPATSWRWLWNGTDQRGRRVPVGAYRIGVFLSGRSAALGQVGNLLPVAVASSQAARPRITVSSATVYPYRDGYLDSIRVSTTAVVPSVMVWTLAARGKVVWSRTFTRRTTAVGVFTGHGTRNRLLPAGTYLLTVTATGGEGVPVARSTTVRISSQRVVRSTFSVRVPVTSARVGSAAGVVGGSVAGSLRVLANEHVATFAARPPSSLRPVVGLRVEVCSHPTQPPGAVARTGWWTGDTASPVLGASAPLATGCRPLGGAPTLVAGAARVYVQTTAAASAPWQVDALLLTGTRYVLR